jgi:hypothetical protein
MGNWETQNAEDGKGSKLIRMPLSREIDIPGSSAGNVAALPQVMNTFQMQPLTESFPRDSNAENGKVSNLIRMSLSPSAPNLIRT